MRKLSHKKICRKFSSCIRFYRSAFYRRSSVVERASLTVTIWRLNSIFSLLFDAFRYVDSSPCFRLSSCDPARWSISYIQNMRVFVRRQQSRKQENNLRPFSSSCNVSFCQSSIILSVRIYRFCDAIVPVEAPHAEWLRIGPPYRSRISPSSRACCILKKSIITTSFALSGPK